MILKGFPLKQLKPAFLEGVTLTCVFGHFVELALKGLTKLRPS